MPVPEIFEWTLDHFVCEMQGTYQVCYLACHSEVKTEMLRLPYYRLSKFDLTTGPATNSSFICFFHALHMQINIKRQVETCFRCCVNKGLQFDYRHL